MLCEVLSIVEGDTLEFDHVPIYDDDVKKRVPSTEKAEADFGWDPDVKLDDSLERCIDNMYEIYDDL